MQYICLSIVGSNDATREFWWKKNLWYVLLLLLFIRRWRLLPILRSPPPLPPSQLKITGLAEHDSTSDPSNLILIITPQPSSLHNHYCFDLLLNLLSCSTQRVLVCVTFMDYTCHIWIIILEEVECAPSKIKKKKKKKLVLWYFCN